MPQYNKNSFNDYLSVFRHNKGTILRSYTSAYYFDFNELYAYLFIRYISVLFTIPYSNVYIIK